MVPDYAFLTSWDDFDREGSMPLINCNNCGLGQGAGIVPPANDEGETR
jgi:hypothetical protein